MLLKVIFCSLLNNTKMKLKLFFIYILLSFICAEISAQTPVNHGCYWPRWAPNGADRQGLRDSTSEDWWYDFKAVPEGHAAFDTGGRYICTGYSCFDDIGLGYPTSLYTNDPCNKYSEINFSSTSYNYSNFDLPDMQHMNFSGTIGLVNLTKTTSGSNPYVWINHYGQGTILRKVIPTSDGGFLATGRTSAFNLPYPTSEPQFADYFTGNTDATIYHQTPGTPAIFNQFTFSCPPTGGYAVDPQEPPGSDRWGVKRSRACLIKVSGDSGKLLWMYTYGPVQFTGGDTLPYKNTSFGCDLVETTDGYILAGIMQNSPVYGNLGNHPFLLKVNTLGVLQWLKQYPDGAPYITEKFMAIQLKDDSTLYAVGERSTTNSNRFTGYPESSSFLNGNDFADKEHYWTMRFTPFLKKINLNTTNVVWDYSLENDSSVDYKARDLSIDINDDVFVPVSTTCAANFAAGECKNSYVRKIIDHGSYADTTSPRIYFGPVRALDLDLGLGVKATTDGGFVVVGTKKPHDLSIKKNYSVTDPARCPYPAPNNLGYNMSSFQQGFSQTDGFVAKANSSGDIEWTTIADNTTQTPGGSFRSTAGNPRDQCNLDTWMNAQATRSKKDIKRQECFYAIATSYAGEIVIGGNMSANIDDSYLAMVENSCDLTLSNHLVQSLPSIEYLGATPISLTNMNNFVASNINTGRTPGNTYDIAEFIVNNGAVINMEAGEAITLYSGTELDAGTIVDVHINTSHTCTAGPVNAHVPYTPSFSRNAFVKDKKPALPANVKPQVIVSPNPTTGLVTIKHPVAIKQLEVFDLYGKMIFKVRANGSGQTKIDFTNTPAGMYLIKIEGISQAIKIMKN